MNEQNSTKFTRGEFWALLGVFFAVLSLVFGYYTWKVNEDRYEKAQSEARERQLEAEKQFALVSNTTSCRLALYHQLIHTERKNEFFELYDQLSDMIKDSVNYMTPEFTEMINNHVAMLQLWASRVNKEELKVSYEQLNAENNQLLTRNKVLYTALCNKLKMQADPRFFEGAYFY